MSAWNEWVAKQDEATQKEITEAESNTLHGQLQKCHEAWIALLRAFLNSIGIHM